MLLLLYLNCPANPLSVYNPVKVNFEYTPSYYRYQEKIYNEDTDSKDYFMSLTSQPIVHSLTLDFKRYISHDWYTQIFANLVLGNVFYDSNGSGYANSEDNLILMIDNSINHCRNAALCASLGYAYRYLDNDAGRSVTSTGNTGYERENFLHLIPIGISYRSELIPHRFSSELLRFKYYYMLDGWQISHFSYYSGCDTDLKNKQKSGFGLETSLRLYSLDRKWFYGANIQYWKIDESDVVALPCFGADNLGSEPDNTTLMIGLIVGYQYL